MTIADRLAPAEIPPGPEEQVVERYRELVGEVPHPAASDHRRHVGLLAGLPAAAQWQDWLLFRNQRSFGLSDPLFDADVGFYVFRLPFLQFLVGWLFAAFVLLGSSRQPRTT
jgi:uncharacterized protein